MPDIHCDWCMRVIDQEHAGVYVNNRWRFHLTSCLNAYKRHTLSVKVETALPLHVQTVYPDYGIDGK